MSRRFAAVVFDRVFDTTPKQEIISLDSLIEGLLRFEVKHDVKRNEQRELNRIQRCFDKWRMGEEWAGRVWRRIREAEHEARRKEEDIHLAVAARVERMRRDAKGLAKKDLRLWSPAYYEPGGRRESRYVRHLSCLVLDYDEGLPIDWATEEWKNYLHIVHTTFSHSAETPKFRIALPLAHPVIAEDWERFWRWGQHRAGMAIDPAPRSPSSTYALPATPGKDAPRMAHVNDGPLLDPIGEGVVTRTAEAPPLMVTDPHSHFHGGAPDHEYIQLKRGSDLKPLNDPDELDEAFEEMF